MLASLFESKEFTATLISYGVRTALVTGSLRRWDRDDLNWGGVVVSFNGLGFDATVGLDEFRLRFKGGLECRIVLTQIDGDVFNGSFRAAFIGVGRLPAPMFDKHTELRALEQRSSRSG